MFEVLVLMYGDYADLGSRCINSIIDNSTNKNLKIHVGLNDCGSKTKTFCREMLDNGSITTLIDSSINLNKDPMMRKLIDCVKSSYLIWFDDDSYINKYGWNDLLSKIIIDNFSSDIFGFIHYHPRDIHYNRVLQKRPWFDSSVKLPEKIIFPVGGIWAARKEYLIKYNYPDMGMRTRSHQHMDDRLLGDMLQMTGGKLYHLPEWDSTFCVNKSLRRGPEITS